MLLILAGVSIAILTGTNGILSQAQKSKMTTEISQIKEEWDLEKLGLQMQEQKTDEINATGEEIKNYIKNMPDDLIGKISIVKGNLAYDINKFTKEEQLTMKSDYGFKATGDTVAPYGSIEKKLKDGKVEITVFSADDESDVDEIILPDGTSKKIQYETENILLRGMFLKEEGISKESLKKYFKNVELDSNNNISQLSEVKNYNVILDLNSNQGPSNYNFLNECFENGKRMITSGNDTESLLAIIDKSSIVNDNFNVQIKKENEITKYYKATLGRDLMTSIKFVDGTNIFGTAVIGEAETDALGEYENQNGNKWIHKHLGELIKPELFYRNAVYRVTGSRSATYIADKNGTYTFKIKDLAGNETEISTEVNEL